MHCSCVKGAVFGWPIGVEKYTCTAIQEESAKELPRPLVGQRSQEQESKVPEKELVKRIPYQLGAATVAPIWSALILLALAEWLFEATLATA